MWFSDTKWFQAVSETSPLSTSLAMPGSHWFPNQHPEKLLQVMQDWLAESDNYVAPSKM
jgi:surfactin synthase thioesterase subunit